MKPMLACSTIPLTSELTYPLMASPKLDGIRCVIVDGYPKSRTLKDIPNHFIRQELASLNLPNLDGELMVRGDFNSVQSAIMSESGEPDFTFVAFDMFDEPNLAYSQRFVKLTEYLRKNDTSGRVESVQNHYIYDSEQMDEAYQSWLENGYEGAIVRSPDGPYKFGRSTLKQGWMLKLKTFNDAEGEIIGFTEFMYNDNESYANEVGASVKSHGLAGQVPGDMLGALEVKYNNVTFKIGTGFDIAMRTQLWDMRDKLIGKLATFKFQELSKYGVPRFPVYKGLRDRRDV